MSFTGHVRNGVVVFDEPIPLPEGAAAEVVVRTNPKQATHFERFQEIIGAAVGLPEDFAENHDHYIHGTPKECNCPVIDAPPLAPGQSSGRSMERCLSLFAIL